MKCHLLIPLPPNPRRPPACPCLWGFDFLDGFSSVTQHAFELHHGSPDQSLRSFCGWIIHACLFTTHFLPSFTCGWMLEFQFFDQHEQCCHKYPYAESWVFLIHGTRYHEGGWGAYGDHVWLFQVLLSTSCENHSVLPSQPGMQRAPGSPRPCHHHPGGCRVAVLLITSDVGHLLCTCLPFAFLIWRNVKCSTCYDFDGDCIALIDCFG